MVDIESLDSKLNRHYTPTPLAIN